MPTAQIEAKAFAECWHAAYSHIDGKLKSIDRAWHSGPFFSWHKMDLNPPFLEHFSFRLGNALFFVRIEDVDGRVSGPGTLEGLFRIAGGQNGNACLMPMRRSGAWTPAANGWGLIDARTKSIIDPLKMFSTEPIEMSDWEVHDVGVDFVCLNLKNENIEIITSQGDPEIYPSIWYRRPGNALGWIMVRATRYPNDSKSIPMPSNWAKVGYESAQMAYRHAPELTAKMGTRGHFVAISIASYDERFKDSAIAEPLRGYRLVSNFSELSDYRAMFSFCRI